MLDIIKNPVIIGMTVGILTYLYMTWENDKKYKKNPKLKKPVNLLIPGVTAIIAWFIAYNYSNQSSPTESTNLSQLPPSLPNSGFKLIGDNMQPSTMSIKPPKSSLSLSDDSTRSYQLIGKGVNVPNNLKLPDEFIETLY